MAAPKQYWFKPGNPGRPKGAVNKLNITIKSAVLHVFNNMYDDPEVGFEAWARKNPTAFYIIASKLIPTEIRANVTKINLNIVRRNQLDTGHTASLPEGSDSNSEEVQHTEMREEMGEDETM